MQRTVIFLLIVLTMVCAVANEGANPSEKVVTDARTVSEGITFRQQTIATLIGALIGFIVSVLLFWVKEYISVKRRERHILRCLAYEFEYNINLLGKYAGEVSESIEKVNAGKKAVYLNINYSILTRHFAQLFYSEGLLCKYLHPEDMKRWNDLLVNLAAGSETLVKDDLEKWREGKCEKQAIFDTLDFERKQIVYAKDMTVYLKEKICPDKKNARGTT